MAPAVARAGRDYRLAAAAFAAPPAATNVAAAAAGAAAAFYVGPARSPAEVAAGCAGAAGNSAQDPPTQGVVRARRAQPLFDATAEGSSSDSDGVTEGHVVLRLVAHRMHGGQASYRVPPLNSLDGTTTKCFDAKTSLIKIK
jgi:hypothetical protein